MEVNTGRTQSYAGRLVGVQTRVSEPPHGWRADNFLRHRARSLPQLAAAAVSGRLFGLISVKPQLAAVHFRPLKAGLDTEQLQRLNAHLRANEPVHALAAHFGGEVVDYGIVSRRLITTAGVGFLVDAWQNLTELENLKYHGVGTGVGAEATGDTALGTESTTITNPDSTRATGSLTEGASANIFRTVGTTTFDGSGAITEHGIFDQAATGGGTLWDRSVFSALNVIALDSIQWTYDMTASAGG